MRVENQTKTRVREDSSLYSETLTKNAVQEFHLRRGREGRLRPAQATATWSWAAKLVCWNHSSAAHAGRILRRVYPWQGSRDGRFRRTGGEGVAIWPPPIGQTCQTVFECLYFFIVKYIFKNCRLYLLKIYYIYLNHSTWNSKKSETIFIYSMAEKNICILSRCWSIIFIPVVRHRPGPE